MNIGYACFPTNVQDLDVEADISKDVGAGHLPKHQWCRHLKDLFACCARRPSEIRAKTTNKSGSIVSAVEIIPTFQRLKCDFFDHLKFERQAAAFPILLPTQSVSQEITANPLIYACS